MSKRTWGHAKRRPVREAILSTGRRVVLLGFNKEVENLILAARKAKSRDGSARAVSKAAQLCIMQGTEESFERIPDWDRSVLMSEEFEGLVKCRCLTFDPVKKPYMMGWQCSLCGQNHTAPVPLHVMRCRPFVSKDEEVLQVIEDVANIPDDKYDNREVEKEFYSSLPDHYVQKTPDEMIFRPDWGPGSEGIEIHMRFARVADKASLAKADAGRDLEEALMSLVTRMVWRGENEEDTLDTQRLDLSGQKRQMREREAVRSALNQISDAEARAEIRAFVDMKSGGIDNRLQMHCPIRDMTAPTLLQVTPDFFFPTSHRER